MGSLATHKTGLLAETIAALYLMLRGWKIIARRFKTPVGEIDIIAKRGGVIAFIEVKHRATLDDAVHAVSPAATGRIRRACAWWLKSHAALADKCDIRFDVIAASPYCRIRHVPNAF